jgi:hypothetical protein
MFGRTAFVLVVLALFAANLIQADGEAEEHAKLINWGPTKEGCRIAVVARQTEYRYDQPIALDIILQNTNTEDIQVFRTALLSMYRIEVKLPDGNAAPFTLEGRRCGVDRADAVGGYPDVIEAGKSAKDAVTMLNRFFDMTKVGDYTVTVHHIMVYPHGSDKAVEVSSQPIVVKVVAALQGDRGEFE